jgi:hypothetical protein
MVASSATVTRLVAVLLKHMTPGKAREFMHDVLEVPGNKSFRDTLAAVSVELEARSRRRR